jgi:DNA-binding transcriptional LysR family regulator
MSQREPIDVHLLRALCALVTERSVTRAAIRLNQSQPATSLALKKLRAITGDPILVRSKTGMAPTDRGLALLEHAKAALEEIGGIVASRRGFDARQTMRAFRIGTRDFRTSFFLPRLISRLRANAPCATLSLVTIDPHMSYEAALEDGTLDVVIGNWPSPPEHLRIQELHQDTMAALVCRKHPYAKRAWSLDEYLRLPHIAPPSDRAGQRNLVDAFLASRHLRRNVVVTLPDFGLAPYVLSGSDLVFTGSRIFCEHYAVQMHLVVREPPIEFPPLRSYQLWHERTQHAEDCMWLRQQIVEAGQGFAKELSSARG